MFLNESTSMGLMHTIHHIKGFNVCAIHHIKGLDTCTIHHMKGIHARQEDGHPAALAKPRE